MTFALVALVFVLLAVNALVIWHFRGEQGGLVDELSRERERAGLLQAQLDGKLVMMRLTPPPPRPLPPPPAPPTPMPIPTPQAPAQAPAPVQDPLAPLALAKSVVDMVSEGIERQMKVMRESVALAWSPQQQPTSNIPIGLAPAVDAIVSKYRNMGLNVDAYGNPLNGYNLPVPTPHMSGDFTFSDPTDDILPSESGMPPRVNAGMIPLVEEPGGLDSLDNPTGIPGFKAGW